LLHFHFHHAQIIITNEHHYSIKNTAKQAQTALLSECTATFPMFSFLSITCKKAIPFLQKKKSRANLLFLYPVQK